MQLYVLSNLESNIRNRGSSLFSESSLYLYVPEIVLCVDWETDHDSSDEAVSLCSQRRLLQITNCSLPVEMDLRVQLRCSHQDYVVGN